MVLVSFMVPVVGNTADTPKPLGLLPFKRSFGRVPTERKKKTWPRLSYEASTGAGRGNLDSEA